MNIMTQYHSRTILKLDNFSYPFWMENNSLLIVNWNKTNKHKILNTNYKKISPDINSSMFSCTKTGSTALI